MRLDFAHQTFRWSSEARGKAHVHCVITGFSHGGRKGTKTIFEYDDDNDDPVARSVKRINPYLIEGPDVLVDARRSPLSDGLPIVAYGNKPSDGGHLIVEDSDKPTDDPVVMKYLRRYVGAQELLHDETRWCLWLLDAHPKELSTSKFIRDRLEKVREFRLNSSAKDTRKYADEPHRFFRIPQPEVDYIGIPNLVSENRQWFTICHFSPDIIASNALYTAVDPDGFLFGILSSKMFILWLRTVGGAMKSDLRFSVAVVYNGFPLPVPSNKVRKSVIAAGQNVLQVRKQYPGTSLAELYNPLAMPSILVKAHKALDRAVDRIYRPRGTFRSDSERLSILFERYSEMSNQFIA